MADGSQEIYADEIPGLAEHTAEGDRVELTALGVTYGRTVITGVSGDQVSYYIDTATDHE